MWPTLRQADQVKKTHPLAGATNPVIVVLVNWIQVGGSVIKAQKIMGGLVWNTRIKGGSRK